jgi:erythrocyte band 7 integral membrane protein
MVLLLYYRLLAQTTLRNILGTKNLHEILSDRESISGSMQVTDSSREY